MNNNLFRAIHFEIGSTFVYVYFLSPKNLFLEKWWINVKLIHSKVSKFRLDFLAQYLFAFKSMLYHKFNPITDRVMNSPHADFKYQHSHKYFEQNIFLTDFQIKRSF